jgi:hypothetical protein
MGAEQRKRIPMLSAKEPSEFIWRKRVHALV